eukprot:scaffold287938_cov33-Attheya_sp.AAC.1
MYLRVTCISEITSTDGNEIVRWALGDTSQWREPKGGKLLWPEQANPEEETWKLWNKACYSTLCHTNQKLYTPLGKWTLVINDWAYIYSESTARMYRFRKKTQQWISHELSGRTRRLQYAKIEYRDEESTRPDAIAITDLVWDKESNPLEFTFTIPP